MAYRMSEITPQLSEIACIVLDWKMTVSPSDSALCMFAAKVCKRLVKKEE